MGKLTGKTALITGASRGIGRAIAQRFAADGARVIINYVHSVKEANALADEIKAAGGEALTVQADIAELSAVDAMFADLAKRVDGLDILVNNAGRGGGGAFGAITGEQYDSVFALNTRAVFFVTQAAMKMMRDGGRIITISSMAAKIRMAGLSTYAASKAAADAFTRIWAQEFAARQITVNSINSGIVETDMVAGMPADRKNALIAMIPMGRIGQPRDIADLAAFLASDDSRWVSGMEIAASGARYI